MNFSTLTNEELEVVKISTFSHHAKYSKALEDLNNSPHINDPLIKASIRSFSKKKITSFAIYNACGLEQFKRATS